MADTAISLETVVSRNEDVLFSEVADGMSLMDIESGKYYHFDQTGARIWKQIDGAMAVSALCDGLQKEFDVDAETCRADTLEFLNELSGLDMLVIQQ
ncbi:PqqD family protein [Pontixanthobacter aquaemixtae]|uniref:PqqD family peptide modification chaperone n=1 Tax=Pontixanthobacter aquaemixtae TaxID=1958940 RepID=A0A844ZVN5_9SPHN|nr:PqqD family protein [Pontixanthobacter aquaemixtae]MXO90817.1 PqqD family peptide modification chaperone [Pontixanthobacter aquaemixtae]